MTFEKAINELDEIVTKLENGKLPLEEAIDLYKKGIDISFSCKKDLENAKLTIKEYKESGGSQVG